MTFRTIFYDWHTTEKWKDIEVYQRKDDDHFILEGEGFQYKATFYLQQFVEEKMLFLRDSNIQSLGKSWIYIAFFAPHKVATTVYNTYLAIKLGAQTGYALATRNAKSFEERKTPALFAATRSALGWGAIAVPLLAYYYTPHFIWNNFSGLACKAIFATSVIYPILHPKMLKVHAAKLESVLNFQTLTNGEISELEPAHRKSAYKTGAISLSYILGMNLVGTLDARIKKNEQFEVVESKKKS